MDQLILLILLQMVCYEKESEPDGVSRERATGSRDHNTTVLMVRQLPHNDFR